MQNPEPLQSVGTDWRAALNRNQRNTLFVIIIFVAIYLALGFFVDLFIYLPSTPENAPVQITLKQIEDILFNLATFKLLPIGTIIMMTVAVLSLIITFGFYKNIMMLGTEYHEVRSDSKESLSEQQLYNVVEELKIAAGLRYMPKIYIIDADYMNAFASGYNEKTAMMAITRGLLEKLDRDELQAVMAHEMSHIRHDDIRLTMTVAILSNLMLIVIDLLFRMVLFGGRRSRDNGVIIAVIVLLRFLLPIITLLLVLYLSRKRELMADSGSVELTRSNEPLARALLKIDSDTKEHQEIYSEEYSKTEHEEVRQMSYLYDPKYAGINVMESINGLFSTHPSLSERLQALGVKVKGID
jgi:heat shock protein HtpX